MSGEDPCKVLQGIHEALNRKDIDGAISFTADDVIATSPDGIFKGKVENKRYFEWSFRRAEESKITNLKFTELRITASGNLVTHEYLMEGTTSGGKMSVPCVAVAEIKDGKVWRVQTYYDRLLLAKQASSGFIASWVVNSVSSQMEKGLK
ncbi:MAG: nuclear transport factor 2 family protein [Candidatus Bathyarchaeia archaeon]|jgi:ketosteroid isomerase-like protein